SRSVGPMTAVRAQMHFQAECTRCLREFPLLGYDNIEAGAAVGIFCHCGQMLHAMADDVRRSITSDDACPSLSSDYDEALSSRPDFISSIASSTDSICLYIKETTPLDLPLYVVGTLAHEGFSANEASEVAWRRDDKPRARYLDDSRSTYDGFVVQVLQLSTTMVGNIGCLVAEVAMGARRTMLHCYLGNELPPHWKQGVNDCVSGCSYELC
ncbi:hypothetical protein LTR95_002664, partial [Oleoguttula sp. CCFEE 5521]